MISAAENRATQRKQWAEKYFVKSPDRGDLTKAWIFIYAGGVAAVLGLIALVGSAFLGIVLLGCGGLQRL